MNIKVGSGLVNNTYGSPGLVAVDGENNSGKTTYMLWKTIEQLRSNKKVIYLGDSLKERVMSIISVAGIDVSTVTNNLFFLDEETFLDNIPNHSLLVIDSNSLDGVEDIKSLVEYIHSTNCTMLVNVAELSAKTRKEVLELCGYRVTTKGLSGNTIDHLIAVKDNNGTTNEVVEFPFYFPMVEGDAV